MGLVRWDLRTENKMDSIQRTLRSLWRRKIAYPVGQVDDYVRHVLREHK